MNRKYIFAKLALFLAVSLLPLLSFAQRLILTGNIAGLPDNTKILLTDLENPGSPLAKTQSRSGAFTLSTKLDAASLLGLAVGDSLKTAVFLSNEKVSVEGAANEKPDTWKFSGSKTQEEFTLFQNNFVPKFENLNTIVAKLQQNNEDSIARKEMEHTVSDIQSSVDDFIKKHPASPVSVLAILSTFNLTEDVSVLQRRVKSLKPAAMNNVFGGQLKKALIGARYNSIGSLALDFSQADTSGKQVTLSQFRGKYVLVDFWASWCGPCRKENHFLVKTFEKYKEKNFTILGVSLDEDRKDWLKAIAKDELKWTHISDLKGWENEVAMKYHITSIPGNFLIGPDGKIVARDLRWPDLDAKLEEILNQNK